MLPDSALEEVKRDLRSMLISEKGGVSLRNIQKDYEMLSCNRLPFKEFGFNDVQGFMRSIPDVAKEMRGPMGDVTYFAVCDESTSHIQRLVSSQKSKKKKVPQFSTRGRGGGRGGRGGINRGAFRGGGRGGRGGPLLPKPNFRPDSNNIPVRPRPPQNMRGGGRWQRGGSSHVSSAADPSIGQSGDWRNKNSSTNGGFSTFTNRQNQTSNSTNGDWGNPTNESGGDWDKENHSSSSSSSVTSPVIRNLRIGVDSKGHRTIDKDEGKELDLREQINNSRARKIQNNDINSSDVKNDYDNAVQIELSGDLRQKLNEMRNEESESSSLERSNFGSRLRGRDAMIDVRQEIKPQESGRGGENFPARKGNFLPRQLKEGIRKYLLSESVKRTNNSRPFAKSNPSDLPPRFRKQQQGGISKHDGGFAAQDVKAEPISPIQHTETYDDTTESKNWVPPENGKLYLEAFYNHFTQLGIPAPTINVVMGKVERQKGFYGQMKYDDVLYYPLEILHTEEEAQQNAARAFCLKKGITLSPPPSSISSLSPSEIEAMRKKIYDIISDSGMWANSLPSLYKETYREDLSPDFLDSLQLASHLFTVEEPVPKRYIIYKVREAMVKLAQVVQMEARRSEESTMSLQLPSLPDIGTQLDVMFSYAYSGDEIYLQKAEHENLLYEIEEVLQTLSKQAPPSASEDLSRCLIAACYEEGWYRAKVLTIGSEKVSVSFVDYGNKEDVTREDVRLLPNDKLVMMTPPLAIPCCLQKPAEVEWKDDFAGIFFSLSETERILSSKVMAHKDNLCVVELYLPNGENIISKVIQPQNITTVINPPTPAVVEIAPAAPTVSPLPSPVAQADTTSFSSPMTAPAAALATPVSSSSTSQYKEELIADDPVAQAVTTSFTSPTTAAASALATPISTTSTSQRKDKLFAEDPEPLCLPESNFFAVHVCRVMSESSVLLRFIDDEYSDKLDELENQIADIFLSWPIPKVIHKSNVYACVILPDESEGEDDEEGDGDKFYRVRVLHKEENGTFECFLLDHGDHEMVQKKQLREIDSGLNASLSYQAILASLHGLEVLLPEQRAVAVEALIKLTMTDGNTFMALRHDRQTLGDEELTASGDGSNNKMPVDPIVIHRVRKIITCLSDIDQAKVKKIYQEVYNETLDNVEEIIKHIPGYGFWKKSLEVELVDTSQDEDFSINQVVLTVLEEARQLQAQGQNGTMALYNYFGGPDSSSASIDGAATADSKSIGDVRDTNVNIGPLANSLDQQLNIVTGSSVGAAIVAEQQNELIDGRPMDRVYSYVQQQADSVVAGASAQLTSSNYQEQQRQEQPSPSSAGRSLYTWSTNVDNVKGAEWISSRPLPSVDETQLEQPPHQSPPPPHSHYPQHSNSGFPPVPHWCEFELNSFSALFILDAESPSDFVAMPYDLRQPLLQMEEGLTQHFSVSQKIAEVLSTSCLYGVNKDGVWRRTLYISSIETLHRILYPDYHQYDTVTLDQLFPLPAQFYALPFLGRKMGLGAIAPTSQDWPESVKFWFIQNTKHKSMYGLIWDSVSSNTSPSGDTIKSIVPKPLRTQLIDTSGEEDVIIDDILCDKGWARHINVE